ncbi:hypothetical protein J2X55_002662 [Microbacterium sp. 1154]|nr:hypothetical protein [Microbacterium sp. 1154]
MPDTAAVRAHGDSSQPSRRTTKGRDTLPDAAPLRS